MKRIRNRDTVDNKWLLLIIITAIVLLFSGLYLVFMPRVRISNNEVAIGEEYKPSIKCYNLFSDLSNKVKIEGKIDNTKVGEYTYNYKVKYFIYSVSGKYIVKVVDKVGPILELKGEAEKTVCPNAKYEEEGYTATDDNDGDISDKVAISELEDKIIYKVKDSSGNESIKERKIIYKDEEEPSIELKGGNTVTIYLGSKYTEPGYSASDLCDGDITDKVVSTGTVDTEKIGSYNITYEVSDSSDNKASIERIVKVIKRPSNNYSSGGADGIIYLTFDDGPSFVTERILNILDEEGVKATFFVCGANEYTRRAYNSGHTIALHSNTHNYSYIYASSSNFFSDLTAISDKVYNVTGYRSNIIRFPGGSSNTISKRYSIGIMSYLTTEVVNRGYTYFDWNVDSNDAGGDTYNSNKIYSNVVNHLSHNKTNVVLMHDSGGHASTAEALRSIIQYGKNNGYEFRAITSSTPVVRHGVNN